MQRRGGNAPQPADLTISDQAVRQGKRDEEEREHQDGGGPQINDRQAAIANVSWHGLSNEPEDGQQDEWEGNPGKQGIWLAQGKLGLNLEQLAESNARPVTRRLFDT